MSVQRIEQMSVTITGDGPDIVMLHGLGGSAHVFQPLVSALEGEFRIIRPELPGSARSRSPLTLSFDSLSSKIESMMQILSVKSAHLMGHSLGTLLCQKIAARSPDQIASLSLFGALVEPPETARQALKQRAAQVRSEGMESVVDAVVTATTSRHTQANQPLVIALVRQLLDAQHDEGYALTCEALAAAKKVEPGLIRCPVLMMGGQEDAVTPPSMMTLLQDQLKDSESHVLDDCGHWTTLEAPTQCAKTAHQFLHRLER